MKYTVIVLICGLLLGCSRNQNNINTITNLNLLADSYLKAFLSTHPEDAYSYGIDIERHDGHPMNDVNEILEWQNYEDSLYSEFQKIDQSKITLAKDKITYWTLKEKLESQIEFRICKQYLWQISHMTGWQNTWLNMARKQPVITESNKSQVLIRWNYFPRFIDNEITNLKSGIEQGYTMPKEIVAVVIDQIQTILDYPIDKSPLIAPAKRATSKTFKDDWTILIQERVLPAIHVYQNYLKEEYYDQAREEVSIVNIPNGSECYQAYIRYWTSTEMTADEIHELGLKVVDQNMAEVIELGQNIYQTSDFTEVIKKSKSDSTQYFKNSGDMLTYNEQFLKTAKLECANWFSSLPSSDVEIYPYEAHEKGSARYEMATSNTPAYFRINLNHPNSEIFGQSEIRNAHEAYPGHHLQIGISTDLQGLHPITKISYIGSYSEGWARYAEHLSEEMNLYKSPSALIQRRAWPSRGMVMDPGVHFHNWTKQDVIDYAVESGRTAKTGELMYQRIIIIPAQLTSYDVGGEEIKRLRLKAESQFGDDFNIKEFHEKILENGAIPISDLTKSIEDWINLKTEKNLQHGL